MKSAFSRQICEKKIKYQIYKNPFSGSGAVPCGRTDRQDEANSRFSQFANASKNGDLMWMKHYVARGTLSAIHDIHTEWYLLE